MRLEKASYKAIKYACIKFHYAKSVPVNVFGYSVFNEKKEWCGVILFGSGANPHISKEYNLQQGQVIELVRMALNGKQGITSKVLSLSLKLIKKDIPLCKLIVSYADKGQDHLGIIYQATNWYFTDESDSSGREAFYKGRWVHDRGPNQLPKEQRDKLKYRKKAGKYKYIYPLDKSLVDMCKSLSKPYPKEENADEA